MKQQIIMKLLTGMAGLGIALGVATAHASPEQDKQDLIKYFTSKYPNVKIDDYVYGALAFDPDSKAQYDAIMEFPPFDSQIDAGRKMWETPFKNGKTYADCLPNGGKMIAGNYPMFDEAKGKVVTLEDVVNDCRVANGETPFKLSDPKTIGTLSAYMRTLSDGMIMNIRVQGPKAMAAYEEGKKTFFRRTGQLNFACATCHIQNAGTRLRSELLSPVVGQAVHWPVFRGGDNLVTLQMRYSGCYKMIRAVPPAEDGTVMNDLEYFHSAMSNGMPMKASVFRK
ncbi:MAG: sulfur oxidation c-type cytochrome SoxA [Hydrogenophilales bacterium]|nr:sulfur oxidation c-type cytochrome SoxA [Hydrogenophilales bacterium]